MRAQRKEGGNEEEKEYTTGVRPHTRREEGTEEGGRPRHEDTLLNYFTTALRTRLDIAHVLGLAEVKGACLGGDEVAVGAVEAAALEAANAKWTESVGVANGTHEFIRDNNDREGALGLRGCVQVKG